MTQSNMSRANQLLATLLMMFLALAPFGLGGNRPQFWLLNAAAILLITAAYFWASSRSDREFARVQNDKKILAGLAMAYPILILCTMAVRSSISDAPANVTAAFGILRVLSYVAFAWLAVQALGNPRRARSAATWLVAVLSALAFYGLLSTENPDLLLYEKTSYLGVATGPFINRNSFATMLALGAVLSLALALNPGGHETRRDRTQANPLKLDQLMGSALAFAPVLLFVSAVLMTGSRMGLFVTFVGLAAVILNANTLTRHGRFAVIIIATFLASALVIGFTLSFGQLTFDRLGTTGESADVRGALYRTVVDMIWAAPFLGHGFDNFEEAYRLYHAAPVSADIRWDQAHNTYLELWSELGLIVGSIPPLLCALAYAALRRRAKDPQTKYPQLAVAGQAAILVAAIHSLVDFSLEMPANVFLLIFIIALGLAPRPASGVQK